MKRAMLLLLTLLMLTACGAASDTPTSGSNTGTTSGAQPTTAPAAKPADSLAAIGRLDEVDEIWLDLNWNGFSIAAPQLAHYELRREGDVWRGQGTFSVGGEGRSAGKTPITETLALEIPHAEMDAFLKALGQTQTVDGAYEPLLTHTDSYPNWTMTLYGPNWEMAYASTSNTEDMTPWSVTYDGTTQVVPNAAPFTAISSIEKHLQRATTIEALVQQFLQ